MGRRQPQYRVEDFEYNGKIFVSIPFSLQKAGSLVRANLGVAPCDLDVVGLCFQPQTVFSDAGTVISVGTYAAPTRNLASLTILNIPAITGGYDFAQPGYTWATKRFSAGELMQVSLDNVAGTTGLGMGTFVAMPASG